MCKIESAPCWPIKSRSLYLSQHVVEKLIGYVIGTKASFALNMYDERLATLSMSEQTIGLQKAWFAQPIGLINIIVVDACGMFT